MQTITLVRPHEANYTPASLLLDYAKHRVGCGYKYGEYGNLLLRLEGKVYEYDHWKITPLRDNEDKITLYLKEVAP